MSIEVQPEAFHVSLSPDLRIIAGSDNIADFIPVDRSLDLLGQPMTALFLPDAIHDLRNSMALLRTDASADHLFNRKLAETDDRFDVTIYRLGDAFGLDGERGSGNAAHDVTGMISGMLDRLERSDDLAALSRAAAAQIRSMLGFDHVAIFIGEDMAGCSSRPGSPIADLASPAPADRLVVATLDAAPAALVGQGDVFNGRSEFPSPARAHADWLQAHGAAACFIVPIVTRGARLGQLCCLHSSARLAGLERRSIVRLFVTILAMRIEIERLKLGA